MGLCKRFRFLAAVAALMVVLPPSASAVPPPVADATSTFEYTNNMHPMGFSANPVPLDNTVPGSGVFNSDLAFWGNTAVQGTYSGFRLVDVSAPANPSRSSTGRSARARPIRSATRATSSSGGIC